MSFDRRDLLRQVLGLGAAAAAGVAGAGAFVSQPAHAAPFVRPAPCRRTISWRPASAADLADACPNHCIKATPETRRAPPAAGTPFIQPHKQACMLCSRVDTQFLRCTEACPTSAFRPIRKTLEEITRKARIGRGACRSQPVLLLQRFHLRNLSEVLSGRRS